MNEIEIAEFKFFVQKQTSKQNCKGKIFPENIFVLIMQKAIPVGAAVLEVSVKVFGMLQILRAKKAKKVRQHEGIFILLEFLKKQDYHCFNYISLSCSVYKKTATLWSMALTES